MKKRKWSIWIIVLLIKSIADIVILGVVSGVAIGTKNYSMVSEFTSVSILTDMLVTVISIIGTKLQIRRVFKDERFEINYHFWVAALLALLIAVMFVIKGIDFDVQLWEFKIREAEAGGEEIRGHAAPAFTLLYMAFALFVFLEFLSVGIKTQLSYRKKRKQSIESAKQIEQSNAEQQQAEQNNTEPQQAE